MADDHIFVFFANTVSVISEIKIYEGVVGTLEQICRADEKQRQHQNRVEQIADDGDDGCLFVFAQGIQCAAHPGNHRCCKHDCCGIVHGFLRDKQKCRGITGYTAAEHRADVRANLRQCFRAEQHPAKEDEMRLRDHSPEELCFYSKGTTDIEFLFPFGWGELWGIADRTDYDLTQHQNVSGQDLTYFDDEKNERYVPYVIEPSLGADRVVLAFLCAAYDEENIGTEEKPDMRTVLHFHPALAPVKIGVLPLSKKLSEGAEKVYAQLSKKYNCEFDDRGNIGKRYRRQDEIGTPFCVTYDFESETDGAVTVRDRDTMEQERVKIEELDAYFAAKFEW